MEELKILQKTFDMMNYAYPALAQYPKGEKFALVVDIKRCMDVMLERIIEANKKYYKKTTLQELDVEVEKLKAYVRLSYNLGFLPRVRNTAFADLRGQLEQWCQRWCLQLEPQQSPLQCELEHRFPLRSAFKSDAADLMGVQSVQRCKGFRLLCSRKKM